MRARAMKPSGLGWAGDIPADWEVASLSSRFEIQLGKMLSPEAANGEFQRPYLGNQHVQWDRVLTAELPTMSIAPHELERYRVRAGDLLVCEGGEVGRTAMWRGELDECCYQKALHRVRPRDGSSLPRFAYYLLTAAAGRGVFEIEGNRSTIVHLTGEKLRRHRFPFPSALEQRRIADFLDRKTAGIDALIEKKEQLLALLAEQRQVLITQAVTKGLDPRAPMRESGIAWIGQVPTHWDVAPLGSRYEVQLGKMLDTSRDNGDGEHPYLRNANVQWGKIDIDDVKTMSLNARDRERYRLADGDLLVCEGGANINVVGKSAIWRNELAECYYQKALHRLRPRSSGQLPTFLLQSLWAAWSRGVFIAGANPNTVFHLTAIKLRAHRLPFPPVSEQAIIAAHLETRLRALDGLTHRVRSQIEKLREYRQALITAAVTGQIDVTSAPALARASRRPEDVLA